MDIFVIVLIGAITLLLWSRFQTAKEPDYLLVRVPIEKHSQQGIGCLPIVMIVLVVLFALLVTH
jgi:hypothetical protein